MHSVTCKFTAFIKLSCSLPASIGLFFLSCRKLQIFSIVKSSSPYAFQHLLPCPLQDKIHFSLLKIFWLPGRESSLVALPLWRIPLSFRNCMASSDSAAAIPCCTSSSRNAVMLCLGKSCLYKKFAHVPAILPCPTRNSALSVSTTSLYIPGSSVP